jgi:hypothetical protein
MQKLFELCARGMRIIVKNHQVWQGDVRKQSEGIMNIFNRLGLIAADCIFGLYCWSRVLWWAAFLSWHIPRSPTSKSLEFDYFAEERIPECVRKYYRINMAWRRSKAWKHAEIAMESEEH